MTVLKVFLLLQGLLLAAWGDVWPADQELKDGEEDQFKHTTHQQQDGWDHRDPHEDFGTGHHRGEAQKENTESSGTVHYPLEHGHVKPSHEHPSEDLPVEAEGGLTESHSNKTPTHMGNWCAFVQKRVVTMAVSCGSEKYIIKSQSPCPNGTPDCHLIMYKLSTRPVYREKQKIFTALLWRCCPGHGGKNCEDNVEKGHVSESEVSSTGIRLHPGGPELNDTESEMLTYEHTQEQNDHQESSSLLYESLKSEEKQTKEQHSHHHTPSPHTGHPPHHERSAPNGVDDGNQGPPSEKHYSNPGLVPIHYLKDVMMSHLQPIFDSFNLTLARLSEEVQDLQRDMTELQLQQMVQGEAEMATHETGEELVHSEAMTDTFEQREELNRQLSLQRDEMDRKLHAQQVMLHYNFTHLKMDTDVHIKRNQKMLQTSLNALNSSLTEMREKQELLEDELQRVFTLVSHTPSPGEQPEKNTAVWEAITRLDNKVVNNTVQLSALNADQAQVTKNIQQLQKGWKTLEENIKQNHRNSEDRYIEAFLEVDAAKVAIGKHADNLSKNVSALQSIVQELEVDTDYLYTQFYRNMSSGGRDCDCTGLSTSVAQLRRAVTNITVIASENRLALDRAAEERLNIWGKGGWGPLEEKIKLDLLTVRNLLVTEQEKRRIQQQNLTHLETSLRASQLHVKDLQQKDSQKADKINHLVNSFNSLLKDAIRHTDVLEILLGQEVLEFIDLSPEVQKAHSIPTLKMYISDLQEQIRKHSQSLASMLNSEDPTADEPSVWAEWITEDLKRRQEEQKFDHPLEDLTGHKDKDFFALEKNVEQLRVHVVKLKEQQCLSCCSCTKGAASKDVEEKIQADLTSVRKSLDDHLRIFSSVFSNTEGLTASDTTVDLEKLFVLMKKKEAKLLKKRQKQRANTRGAERNKRDVSLRAAVPGQLPQNPLMFVASNRDGVNTPGRVVFETTSLNHGQMYSPKTGMFRAPVSGVYLFVLTLEFGPGQSLAQLMKGEEVAALLHQGMREPSGPATHVGLLQLKEGEEVQLKLVQGTLKHGKPQENTFTGLLLLHTT